MALADPGGLATRSNTSAWEAKLFQASVLLIFVAVPAVSIVRCIVEAETRDISE
jgi:hypothetical protein